jgi:hypothetical protein
MGCSSLRPAADRQTSSQLLVLVVNGASPRRARERPGRASSAQGRTAGDGHVDRAGSAGRHCQAEESTPDWNAWLGIGDSVYGSGLNSLRRPASAAHRYCRARRWL